MGTGAGDGSPVSFSTSFSDINTGLFGNDSTVKGNSTTEAKENTNLFQTSQLNIDKEGLLKLVDDALKGTGGLAELFGQEADAGLFDASATKQGTEDLISKIVGELAKVTGRTTTSEQGFKNVDSKTKSKNKTESAGLLDDPLGAVSFGIF